MSWNFDISQAPKGRPIKRTVIRKGKTVEVDDYEHVKIIAASKCGIVTVSKWLPDSQRWEMFGENEQPIAWQIFPTHPDLEA